MVINNFNRKIVELVAWVTAEARRLNEEIFNTHPVFSFNKKYTPNKDLGFIHLKDLKRWFKKDLLKWMIAWDQPSLDSELLIAEISVTYRNKFNRISTSTESYRVHSTEAMGNKLRLYRWQLILVLATISKERDLDGNRTQIISVDISLDWVSLPKKSSPLWQLISRYA